MRKVLVFALFLLALNVYSTNYYVSPAGTSGAAGTIGAPLTFSSALGKSLTAGDSLILRGGTYSFAASLTVSKSGNSTKFFTIVAYPGETPVFDFRTQPYNSANQGVKVSGNYILFKGVIIQGAGDNGMQVTGSNNVIENCTFRWNCDSGLQMKTGSNNLIKNCDSYENFDYMTGGASSPDFGGNADGFADKQYTNTGTNTYKGCRAWFNSDDGWDSYEKVGNTVYDSCWCYANGPASYDMTEHIRFKTDSASWFSNFKNTSGRYVITNYGNGNGFKVGGNYTANNAVLNHCVSVANTVKGFDQNNNNGTMTLYNCTGYLNNPDYGFSNSSYGTLLVKNSASLSSKSSNKLSAKSVTQSNNSWLSGFSCTASDFVSLDYTQLIGSRNSDGTLPDITCLHLVSSSAMIDKGVDVGLSYLGNAPDLGAFEYKVVTSVSRPDNNSGISAVYISSQKQILVPGETDTIEVYNIKGNLLFKKANRTTDELISAQTWDAGIYIVRSVSQNKDISISKIVVM